MEDIFDFLKENHYEDKPVYDGKYVFPNTRNIDADWLIFGQTLKIMLSLGQYNIEDYFYWLSFCETAFLETHVLDDVNGVLRNLILEENDNFYLTTALGSLVSGYGLIIPKRHVLSMSALEDSEKVEYVNFLNNIRYTFYKAFGQRPMVFEHGSNIQYKPKSNSINHAHSHIVCHKFSFEDKIINDLGMSQVSSIETLLTMGQENNYISYISPDDRIFYTDSCHHDSQLMRKYIAKDIGIDQLWNWRENFLLDNMFETAKNLSLQRIRAFDKEKNN